MDTEDRCFVIPNRLKGLLHRRLQLAGPGIQTGPEQDSPTSFLNCFRFTPSRQKLCLIHILLESKDTINLM